MDQLRTNTTLKELIAGAAAYCLVWEVILLILTERKLYHSIGLLAGLIICVVLAVNMAQSIDVAVHLNEKGARAYIQKKASLRYIIVCAAVVLLALSDIGNPLTFFAGIMGLKIGAYMQPFTHKIFEKISNKRGESADE
jgi:hypothetical protein